jgi:hypothetical protein
MFRLFLSVLLLSTIPAIADQPWTMTDSDVVADAAVAAAIGASKDANADRLINLADALVRAGNNNRAKVVLTKAGAALGPPTNLIGASTRGNVIEKLAKLGDIADAEALAQVDAPPDVKAMLLGKFGAGRARAGDAAAAMNAATMVTAIAETNTAPDSVEGTAAQRALEAIGSAFGDSGAPDVALHLTEAMKDGLPKLRVFVRIAHISCTLAKPANKDVSH